MEKKKSFVDFSFSTVIYCLVIAWVIIEENHKRDFLQQYRPNLQFCRSLTVITTSGKKTPPSAHPNLRNSARHYCTSRSYQAETGLLASRCRYSNPSRFGTSLFASFQCRKMAMRASHPGGRQISDNIKDSRIASGICALLLYPHCLTAAVSHEQAAGTIPTTPFSV